jgi:Rod binding domain-containing protein
MHNGIDNSTTPIGTGAVPAQRALSLSPGDREQAFDALLAGKRAAGGQDAASRRAEAREAANGLVSVTFLMPMLKMMREDPFKSEMFHGGRGEEIFGAQLDEVLADRMAQSMQLPLADAVYRRILGEANESNPRVNVHG